MNKGKYHLKIYHFGEHGELLAEEGFDMRIKPLELVKKFPVKTYSTNGMRRSGISEETFQELAKTILKPMVSELHWGFGNEEPKLTWEKKVKSQLQLIREQVNKHYRDRGAYPSYLWSITPHPEREDLLDLARVLLMESI